jgi:phosphatidylserine synthase
MLRRFWPIGAMILGARLLFANFMVTTAHRQNFFDGLSTPIGLILIIVGGYFLAKDYD